MPMMRMVFMPLSRISGRPRAMLRLMPKDRTIAARPVSPGKGDWMNKLSWLRLDSFTLAIAAVVLLALVLPCSGESARLVGIGSEIAIVVLFFLQGARVSRPAVLAGILHWRLHLIVLGATFVVFPLLGLAMRPLSDTALAPPLYVGLLFLCTLPSTVQFGSIHLDRRRQCSGGAVQRLAVERRRHGGDAAAGRPPAAGRGRALAERCGHDRDAPAVAVPRRADPAALARRLAATPPARGGAGRSYRRPADGLWRVQRSDPVWPVVPYIGGKPARRCADRRGAVGGDACNDRHRRPPLRLLA